MNTAIRTAVALAAIAGLSAALAAPATSPAPDPEPIFHAAQLQYEANHWLSAYAGFVRAAALGHCEAARIARQMYQFGPRLYGVALPAPATGLPAAWQAKTCDRPDRDGGPAG